MLITRRHGSWVVLGTLITTVEVEATPPLELDCGSCTLCIDACPTAELDEQVYGCDICQDVCPWNRGIERRRAGETLPETATPHVRLVDWLTGDADEVRQRYDRLYVPRNDARYLRRNALIALGNTGEPDDVQLAETFLADEDDLLSEQARWTVRRIEERQSEQS